MTTAPLTPALPPATNWTTWCVTCYSESIERLCYIVLYDRRRLPARIAAVIPPSAVSIIREAADAVIDQHKDESRAWTAKHAKHGAPAPRSLRAVPEVTDPHA